MRRAGLTTVCDQSRQFIRVCGAAAGRLLKQQRRSTAWVAMVMEGCYGMESADLEKAWRCVLQHDVVELASFCAAASSS